MIIIIVSLFNGRRHWNPRGGVLDSKLHNLQNDRAGLGIKQANKIEIPTLCGKASL